MFGLPAEKPWTLENFFAVIFSWDTEEVNLPNFVSTAMFFSFATNHCFPISHFYKYWKPNWHSWQLGNLTIHCTVRRWGRRGVKKQRGRTANRTETNEHFAWDREIVQVIICRMKEVGLISICCRLLNGTSSFPPPLANWLLIVGYSTIHGFETPETPRLPTPLGNMMSLAKNWQLLGCCGYWCGHHVHVHHVHVHHVHSPSHHLSVTISP